MFDSVLVVCTGNICRSPMGEYLLRDRWTKPGVHVASAGIAALINYPAEDDAITVMQQHGIDMSRHHARQMSARLAAGHDLILTMEPLHVAWIHRRIPTARGRVHLMGKWLGEDHVADPYREGVAAFEACYAVLDRAVDSWLERF